MDAGEIFSVPTPTQAGPHVPCIISSAQNHRDLYYSRPLTKNRPENCGQRASLAVLGCLRLEQQNSWNLALQNVEQLKWILSQTGGDGEETNHSCPPLSPASSCAWVRGCCGLFSPYPYQFHLQNPVVTSLHARPTTHSERKSALSRLCSRQ